MVRLIKRYPIWSFILINYAISWSFLYPSYQIIKANDGIVPLALIGFIGAYGPSIAAVIVQRVTRREKVKELLKKFISFKFGLRLLVFTVLIPIVLYGLAHIMAAVFYKEDLTIHWMPGISNMLFWFMVALPFGPMGEELGWRGFLLPRLLEQYSVMKSTLLVGLAWGIWHMASFSFPGAAIPSFMPVTIWTILLYLVNTISLSLIFTYAHLRSKGSVFIAIILHAFFNAASNIVYDFFGETENTDILTLAYILNIVWVALVGLYLIRRPELALKPAPHK